MIEKYYEDAPDQFKSAWLNENNPKGLIIKFVDYKRKVNPAQGDNPKTNGWYEHNDKAKKYTLTEDTSVVEDKLYFEQVSDNLALTYTDQTIENDSFKLKRSLQSGSNIDFMGCIASSLEFKVENDFKYIKDQKLYAELTVTEEETLWKIRVFTGIVEEVKRDKSRDIIRIVTAYDFLHRLLDNYDVTDWYVWQYGEGKSNPDINHSIYDLRNSFWDYITNSGTVVSPDGIEITKKNEGWDQVQYKALVNDSKLIPKTLDVTPIKYDEYVGGSLIGGPFRKVSDYIYEQVTPTGTENPHDEGWYEYRSVTYDYIITSDTSVGSKVYYKRIAKADYDGKGTLGTQYMIYNIPDGIDNWNVTDLVARNQVIQLGAIGTLFTYTYNGVTISDTTFRQYMDHCDTLYEQTGTDMSGIPASIKIPVETQDKVRETQIFAATVLQAFCQFNGVFGQCNGYGKFDYIKLDTTNATEIEEQYQIEVGTSDIQLPNITSVVIFDKTSEEYSDDTIHTEYGDVKNGKKGSALAYYPNDRTKVYGFDSNPYVIDDNFLMNSLNQSDAIDIAKNLYNNISDLTMRNSDITIKAMPWLNNGEAIYYYIPSELTLYPSEDLYPSPNLYPSGYQRILTLVMSQEISGTGLFKQKIECKADDLSGDIVSLNEVISDEVFSRKIGSERQYSLFKQTTDSIELRVQKTEREYSEIKQTSDEILLRVIDLDEQTSGITSEIRITKNEVAIHGQRISTLSNQLDIVSHDVSVQAERINVMASEVTFLTEHGVTFQDLSDPNSRTVINGSHITTGSIDGQYIAIGTISCNRIKMSEITIGSKTYTIKWSTESVIGFDYLDYGLEEISVVVLDTTNPINVTRNSQGLVTDVTLNTHSMDVVRFLPTGSTNVPKAYAINDIAASQFVYLGSEPETIT